MRVVFNEFSPLFPCLSYTFYGKLRLISTWKGDSDIVVLLKKIFCPFSIIRGGFLFIFAC